MSALTPAGLRPVLGLTWHTRKVELVAWVLGVGAVMAGTAASLSATYDTPAKIRTYADSVTGGALEVINGHVEGIDTLGGVIQDEFGFIASFLLPLLGIALLARGTRRDEETGRLEITLGGAIDRRSPMVGALVTAILTIGLVVAAFTASLASVGIDLDRALLYSLSLGTLAFLFTALAAVASHLVLHTRGVYTLTLGVLVVSYALRGIGDVTGSWITWLSPLGWAEKAAAFGGMRWWTLALPLVVGLVLIGVAFRLSSYRDLGGALIPTRAGRVHAGRFLRSMPGLATHQERGTILAWLAGVLVLAAMFGSLTEQILDALSGNPDLASALGSGLTISADGIFWLVTLYAAVVVSGLAVHLVSGMRAAETGGRLEHLLAGGISRTAWFTSYVGLAAVAIVVVSTLGAAMVALTAAASTGDMPRMAATFGAAAAYLPAELALAGVAFAAFGLAPRLLPAVWGVYAVVAFVALLGDGLKLPGWCKHLAATSWVGSPPTEPAHVSGMVAAGALAVVLTTIGYAGFLRRQVPTG